MSAESTPHPVEPARPALGDYEIHTAREGFASVLHRASGEIMHSRSAPMEEARNLYVGQAALAERLKRAARAGELVLWDVGLGAAANAAAAIECYEAQARLGPVRAMRIVSFENDLDSLRLALAHRERFPYLAHAAPAALLERGVWESRDFPGLSWQLIEGDFVEAMARAPGPPEVIFYDLFSTKTHPEAWAFETFRRLFAVCGAQPVELFTYTVSTASRAAMLAAGFWVARGRPAGGKQETTILLTAAARELPCGRRRELLGAEWLGKWTRSRAQFPHDLAPEEQTAFAERIRGHVQFRDLALG